ncbi:hypothetical protein GMO_13410 [Gluconobacter morbifer G707]|uniref:Uncharacterized protein n=1 Tax=Gluconobacter morbifer G707 TaxID=1088869 RepID=G6XID1_9PROT|nr:hypothetical protein GMO_13410 [Gluconobacter morbifer G707]
MIGHIAHVSDSFREGETIRTHDPDDLWCPARDVVMRRFNQMQGILNHGSA